MQFQENVPVATCNLTPAIKNKILNYEVTVQPINVDNKISFSSSAGEYERSAFCDEHHSHIITRGLRIITNTKLRSLLSRGSNYGEPNTINFIKCRIAIDSSIDNSIGKLKMKYKLTGSSDLNDWDDFVRQEVLIKIKNLRRNGNFYMRSAILNNENVKTVLLNFQKRCVILPIDKATKSFSFNCKKFYISKIFNEVGLNGTPNPAHEFSSKTKYETIYVNISFSYKFVLNPDERDKSLPVIKMFWARKMRKPLISHVLLLPQKNAVRNLFQKQFLKFLNLSSIKYKSSMANFIFIL